jgi:hypothetical protein
VKREERREKMGREKRENGKRERLISLTYYLLHHTSIRLRRFDSQLRVKN